MRFSFLLALVLIFGFQGAAFAGFDEGLLAYNRKDWKGAIVNMRPAAEAGDDRAMVILANMYADGLGVQKDSKEAFRLYHRAAEKNNAAAMLAIAGMYQQGVGIAANSKLAIDWFKRSADLGHQTGAFFYAMSIYQGSRGKNYDIKPDSIAAYQYLRIAAKTGNNENIKRAATALADTLGQRLNGQELTEADQKVTLWKPIAPEALGPLPEEMMLKEGKIPAADKPATEAPKAEAPKADIPKADVPPQSPDNSADR